MFSSVSKISASKLSVSASSHNKLLISQESKDNVFTVRASLDPPPQ